jgi:hypothetical protein
MITTEKGKGPIKDDKAKAGFGSECCEDLEVTQRSPEFLVIKPKGFIVCYLLFPFFRGSQLLLTL